MLLQLQLLSTTASVYILRFWINPRKNAKNISTKRIRIILGTPHPIPDTDNHNSVRKTRLSGLHCRAEMRNGSLRMHPELESSVSTSERPGPGPSSVAIVGFGEFKLMPWKVAPIGIFLLWKCRMMCMY